MVDFALTNKFLRLTIFSNVSSAIFILALVPYFYYEGFTFVPITCVAIALILFGDAYVYYRNEIIENGETKEVRQI